MPTDNRGQRSDRAAAASAAGPDLATPIDEEKRPDAAETARLLHRHVREVMARLQAFLQADGAAP